MAKAGKLLQLAIDKLVIEDVYPKSQRASCADDFDPKYADWSELKVQQMHAVRKTELLKVEGDGCLARIHITLGARWVDLVSDEGSEVKAFIEANFVAEYRLHDELEQAALDEFALKNASYHVWPYWRELLSSHCDRLRLPRITLPAVQFSKQTK